jgi:hypothetical protein
MFAYDFNEVARSSRLDVGAAWDCGQLAQAVSTGTGKRRKSVKVAERDRIPLPG